MLVYYLLQRLYHKSHCKTLLSIISHVSAPGKLQGLHAS